MPDFQITCKVHDENEVIIKIGIDNNRYLVGEIYDWIENGKHTFYTKDENGKRANVRTGKSSDGQKFITTHPDGVTENNLDEIPSC